MTPEADEPGPAAPEPEVPAVHATSETAAEPAAGTAPEPAAGVRRQDRTLLAILAAIAVLVVLALIVVFVRGEPAPLDEATPAGVVQRYSAAVIAGDETAAAAYLTEAAKANCVKEMPPMGADNLRVTLVSTTERPASADVKVLMTVSEGGGPFGSAEYQIEDVFDLVRTGDVWLIERAPWQLSVCQPAAVK